MKHQSDPLADTTIDVYPVGVLATLFIAYRNFRRGCRTDAYRNLRSQCRRLARATRRRDWRSFRNSFNGYLAEPYDWPEGLKGCGHGWTKRRALRSLAARMRTGR